MRNKFYIFFIYPLCFIITIGIMPLAMHIIDGITPREHIKFMMENEW